MKKEEYLKLLKHRLSVIEENELNDILSEYRQHIEMKIESGVDEEEAISDFGDVDILASEILEAYHVRSDYNSQKDKKETFKEIKEKSEDVFGKAAASAKSGIYSVKGFFKKIFTKAGAFFKKVSLKAKSFFARKKKEPESSEKKKDRCIWQNIKHSTEVLRMSFVSFIKWIFRMCFNILLIIFGCTGTVFSAAFIILLGFSIVLFAGGYPVVGITITLLGLSAVFATLSMLSLLSVKREKAASVPQKEGEENVEA